MESQGAPVSQDNPTAFDPEAISILSGALADAWQAVKAP
jgi:hypothetical protein